LIIKYIIIKKKKGYFFFKKIYSLKEILSSLLIILGLLSLYTFNNVNEKNDIFGFIYLLISLSIDSILHNLWENQIKTDSESIEIIFFTHFIGSIFILIYCLILNQLFQPLNYCLFQNTLIIPLIFFYSIFGFYFFF
jgi:hypothetical protein